MKPAKVSVAGMTRLEDHRTSIAAAEMLMGRRLTIREQVIRFALMRPQGFTDGDLIEAFPGHPESSFRKRRTELAQENIIVSHGDEAKNQNDQPAKIWRHRDHCLYPPPIKAREVKPSRFDALRNDNARLRAELKRALTRLAEVHDDHELWRDVA